MVALGSTRIACLIPGHLTSGARNIRKSLGQIRLIRDARQFLKFPQRKESGDPRGDAAPIKPFEANTIEGGVVLEL